MPRHVGVLLVLALMGCGAAASVVFVVNRPCWCAPQCAEPSSSRAPRARPAVDAECFELVGAGGASSVDCVAAGSGGAYDGAVP